MYFDNKSKNLDDGNIYTVALIDKLLNPGETAELKIILEKVWDIWYNNKVIIKIYLFRRSF